MYGYNEETTRRTEEEILAAFERKYKNKETPFDWNLLEGVGIIPKNLIYDNELYNALLYGRYTPPVNLRVPGGCVMDGTKASYKFFLGRDGKWTYHLHGVGPKLTLDSVIELNQKTTLKPIEGEPVNEKQRKAEVVRRALVFDGFYQGLVTLNAYNATTKEFYTYEAGVCINPYSNKPITMEPKRVRSYLFSKGNNFHGAELSDQQVEDICNFKEVFVEGMINGRGETYDRYVRFDIFNNAPRMSETPTISKVQSQSQAQAESLEEKQEEVQEKKSTRAKGRGIH